MRSELPSYKESFGKYEPPPLDEACLEWQFIANRSENNNFTKIEMKSMRKLMASDATPRTLPSLEAVE